MNAKGLHRVGRSCQFAAGARRRNRGLFRGREARERREPPEEARFQESTMTPSTRRSLEHAENCWQAGNYTDAWQRLKELPYPSWEDPAVRSLQLRLCPPLEEWQFGDWLVQALAESPAKGHRITCAAYALARARKWTDLGEPHAARAWIRRAVDWWEPMRAEVLEDEELLALF